MPPHSASASVACTVVEREPLLSPAPAATSDAGNPVGAGFSRRDAIGLGAGALAAAAMGLAGCSSAPPTSTIAQSSQTISYGTHAKQVAVLRLPLEATARPLVVMIHGGYWRQGLTNVSLDPLTDDLANLGYATWNLDYRTIDDGGGWPATLDDVVRGINQLLVIPERDKLDFDRVVFLGHSAGAQLAMLAAVRAAGTGRPAVDVKPKGLVSLSGVLDLELATRSRSGELAMLADSTTAYLGGSPAQRPDRYADASPIRHVPYGIPSLLLHGGKDVKVPPEQSRAFVDAAVEVGDAPTLVELPNAGHSDVILANKAWWDEVVRWLPTVVGSPLGPT